jgi:caffeoyl-CoA O-methyltransferase
MADPTSRQGTGYATPEILAFLHATHTAHDEGLERAFVAPERHGLPAIQVGPAEGKLLELLVRIAGARRAVEIGTLVGYSAIRLARALPEGGHLWTCERERETARIARENIAAAGLAERVDVVEGAALTTLPSLEAQGPFDLVFIDADKGNYDHYGRWAVRHLRPGGLLLGDNAFFFGNLLDDSAEAQAMRRFHQEAAVACDTVCIPTPDGLLLGVKR